MIRSAWGSAVGVVVEPNRPTTSPWGSAVGTLSDPRPTVASPWGGAVAVLAEPHRPFGVWTGTAIQWVAVEFPDA